ncbi:MAG: hypothetical protein ABFS21_06745 [Actinomycetota bacterium]
MSDMPLDGFLQELSDIQDRLNALPSDAFAERYELRCRQDELRDEMASLRVDFDAEHSTEDLLAELAGQRSRLSVIETDRIDIVSQSGGGTMSGAGSDGWGAVGINQQIEAGAGVGEIRARIGRIKGILIDRGVDVPDAPE